MNDVWDKKKCIHIWFIEGIKAFSKVLVVILIVFVNCKIRVDRLTVFDHLPAVTAEFFNFW